MMVPSLHGSGLEVRLLSMSRISRAADYYGMTVTMFFISSFKGNMSYGHVFDHYSPGKVLWFKGGVLCIYAWEVGSDSS